MALQKFDFKALDRWSGLVLGYSGAGKTTLISTIPEDQRVMIVSSENGLLAIRNMLLTRKNVTALTLDNWSDFVSIISYLDTEKAQKSYDWVCFDSLTAIGNMCYDAMKKEWASQANTYTRYGKLGEHLTETIIKLRDMTSYNVLFTCLVEHIDNPTSEIAYKALIPGRVVPNEIFAWFDEVLFITVDRVDRSRHIMTDYHEGFMAKDRSGRLDYCEVPNLGIITQKILGTYVPPEVKNNES
jgi:hypothetical protein